MNDLELEERVRRTLRTVGDHTPVSGEESLPRYSEALVASRRRWAIPVGAAAAAVALVIGAVLLVQPDDDVRVSSPSSSTPSTSPPPTAVVEVGSDVIMGGPIFSANGGPEEVVDAYLAARFPDYPEPGVTSELVEATDFVARASWATGDDSGRLAGGTIQLRRIADRWTVIEATTDEVHVENLAVTDRRLRALLTSTRDEQLRVEVLDLDGNPLPGSDRSGAVRPAGIDVPLGLDPVVLRAQLVGGTMLSITEIYIDPGAPTGTVLAEGQWQGGAWQILAADNVPRLDDSPCGWVALDGLAQSPTCGVDGDGVFHALGPVAADEDHTLYFGSVGREVASVRITLPDGQAFSAESVPHPTNPDGARFVAIGVPRVESAEAAFLAADGQVLDTVTIQPAGALGG